MGCGDSKVFIANNNVEGQDKQTLNDLINVIHLTAAEVNIIYSAFRKIDVTGCLYHILIGLVILICSGDGSIDLVEFLHSLNMEETPVTKEVFSEFDSGKDQSMNFREVWIRMTTTHL